MFRLTYESNGITLTEDGKDVDGIHQSLISIMNNPSAEQEAVIWCSNAKFGQHFVNQKYKVEIECYQENNSKVNINKLNEVITKIYDDSGIDVCYCKEDNNKSIFNVAIGTSLIIYNHNNKEWEFYPIGSDGQRIGHHFKTDNTKIFIHKAVMMIEQLMYNKQFEVHRRLKDIVNSISNKTNIENKWIGIINNSLTIRFNLGKSYINNIRGRGLYFELADDNGKKLASTISTSTNTKEFVYRVSTIINKYINEKSIVKRTQHSMKNEEIVREIRKAIENKEEKHFTIYDDGVWKIDMERHTHGLIRFWVSREDKRGNYKSSLLTIYDINGNIRHSAEFIVKETALNKAISAYKALNKAGCIE